MDDRGPERSAEGALSAGRGDAVSGETFRDVFLAAAAGTFEVEDMKDLPWAGIAFPKEPEGAERDEVRPPSASLPE